MEFQAHFEHLFSGSFPSNLQLTAIRLFS